MCCLKTEKVCCKLFDGNVEIFSQFHYRGKNNCLANCFVLKFVWLRIEFVLLLLILSRRYINGGRLIEVTTMGELSLGPPKNVLLIGLISHSFLQLFWDFDYWPLNSGPRNGGSTVFLVAFVNARIF